MEILVSCDRQEQYSTVNECRRHTTFDRQNHQPTYLPTYLPIPVRQTQKDTRFADADEKELTRSSLALALALAVWTW